MRRNILLLPWREELIPSCIFRDRNMDVTVLKEFKKPDKENGESFPFFEQVPDDTVKNEGNLMLKNFSLNIFKGIG